MSVASASPAAASRHLVEARAHELAFKHLGRGEQAELLEAVHEGLKLVRVEGKPPQVFVVGAWPELRHASDEIRAQRERGLSEARFSIVVATTRPDVAIDIDGLAGRLADHLLHRAAPQVDIGSGGWVTDVVDLELDTVRIDADGIRVAGSGIAEVDVRDPVDGDTHGFSLPLGFDVVLGPDLDIVEVHRCEIDESSAFE